MYIYKHIHTRMHAQRPLQTDTQTHTIAKIHIDIQTDLEKATAPTEWV